MSPIGNKASRPHPLRSTGEIGALVKQRRKEQQLTQDMVAQQAGVGRRFLIELEDGKPTLQLEKVLRVLRMLGITLTGSYE